MRTEEPLQLLFVPLTTESFLSHPNANICTLSMEINITDVSAAQRHSTKHAPCWQKPLLCHMAVPETSPSLPCFLSLPVFCRNYESFPSSGSSILDLLANVMTSRLFLPPCYRKILFSWLFLGMLALCSSELLFPFECTFVYSTGVGTRGGAQFSCHFTLLHSAGNRDTVGSTHCQWHC